MTTTLAREAAEFAAAVRRALSDLPADVVDDLVDGLEADLVERSLDDGAGLGDPVAYAAELRSAAGLDARRGPALLDGVGAELRRLPRRVRDLVEDRRRTHPALDASIRFLVTLRPAWWLLRAWLVWLPLRNLLGGSFVDALLGAAGLVALAVVSVQFGRGRWMPRRWMKGALAIVNVLAVIAAPFALAWVLSLTNPSYDQVAYSEPDLTSSGLMENGAPVSNILVYDADGRPLTDVQLFDQDGKPLNTVSDGRLRATLLTDRAGALVPNHDVAGRLGWNVYPLREVDGSQVGADGLPQAGAITHLPKAKSSVRPLLKDPAPAATATPGPSATPTPSASPAP